MKSTNDIPTNLKEPLLPSTADASRGPRKDFFTKTLVRARSKIFKAFSGGRTAARSGAYKDSRFRVECSQDVGCTARSLTSPVTMRQVDIVDTTNVTIHKSTDEVPSSAKSAPAEVVMALNHELHEWWGPSLTSGDFLVEDFREETHIHNNKGHQIHVRYNRELGLALSALTL